MAKEDLVGTVLSHEATRDEIADSLLKLVADNRASDVETMSPIPAKQRRTSARARAREQAADRVVGYLRCSTDEQAESGLGLHAQRAAVEAACAARAGPSPTGP